MPDKELRLQILRVLQEFYNNDPYGYLEKQNLMQRLPPNTEENLLLRNIKYLSDKGFIKIHNLLGGNFLAQITVDGIDFLEIEG